MPISTLEITDEERDKILALEESHFCDLKATAIAPSKLSRTIAALSNAEGGEIFVGIGQSAIRRNFWAGFSNQEGANGHIQAFETLFPLGDGYGYTFLRSASSPGLVLKVDIAKSREVKRA